MAVARKSLDFLDLRSFEHAQGPGLSAHQDTVPMIHKILRLLGDQG
jgi:hypothetical protein